MTTAIYKHFFLGFLFLSQFIFAQKGLEALIISDGVLLKCDNSKLPRDGSIELPRTVNKIAKEAFKDCLPLKSISIAGTVTTIEEGAFSGCTNLTKVEILPNSVTYIGARAFANCTKLLIIYLPNSVHVFSLFNSHL